eukprot:7763465-Lingulodinium_polyedra.AAC.1
MQLFHSRGAALALRHRLSLRRSRLVPARMPTPESVLRAAPRCPGAGGASGIFLHFLSTTAAA